MAGAGLGGRLLEWRPELHPRDKHGRFRNGWRIPGRGGQILDRMLRTMSPAQWGSDAEARASLSRSQKKQRPRTPAQEASLKKLFTRQGNWDIQGALRGETDLKKAGGPEPTDIKNLDDAMRPTDQDMILTHVTGFAPFGTTPQLPDEVDEWTGKLVSDKGYFSTSAEYKQAPGNPGDPPHVTWSLLVPRGTRAIIRGNGSNSVTLDREQPIRIIKVSDDGHGGKYVHAAVMPREGAGIPRGLGRPLAEHEKSPAIEATPEEMARRGLTPEGQPVPGGAPTPATAPPAGKPGLGPHTPVPKIGEAGPAQSPTEQLQGEGKAQAPVGGGHVVQEGEKLTPRPKIGREATSRQVTTPEKAQAARLAQEQKRIDDEQKRIDVQHARIQEQQAKLIEMQQKQIESLQAEKAAPERPTITRVSSEGGTNAAGLTEEQKNSVLGRVHQGTPRTEEDVRQQRLANQIMAERGQPAMFPNVEEHAAALAAPAPAKKAARAPRATKKAVAETPAERAAKAEQAVATEEKRIAEGKPRARTAKKAVTEAPTPAPEAPPAEKKAARAVKKAAPEAPAPAPEAPAPVAEKKTVRAVKKAAPEVPPEAPAPEAPAEKKAVRAVKKAAPEAPAAPEKAAPEAAKKAVPREAPPARTPEEERAHMERLRQETLARNRAQENERRKAAGLTPHSEEDQRTLDRARELRREGLPEEQLSEKDRAVLQRAKDIKERDQAEQRARIEQHLGGPATPEKVAGGKQAPSGAMERLLEETRPAQSEQGLKRQMTQDEREAVKKEAQRIQERGGPVTTEEDKVVARARGLEKYEKDVAERERARLRERAAKVSPEEQRRQAKEKTFLEGKMPQNLQNSANRMDSIADLVKQEGASDQDAKALREAGMRMRRGEPIAHIKEDLQTRADFLRHKSEVNDEEVNPGGGARYARQADLYDEAIKAIGKRGPAAGKISASDLSAGDRVLVSKHPDGKWIPSTKKTGATPITVTRVETLGTGKSARLVVHGRDAQGHEVEVHAARGKPGMTAAQRFIVHTEKAPAAKKVLAEGEIPSTLKERRDMARDRKIPGYSRMNKDELGTALHEHMRREKAGELPQEQTKPVVKRTAKKVAEKAVPEKAPAKRAVKRAAKKVAEKAVPTRPVVKRQAKKAVEAAVPQTVDEHAAHIKGLHNEDEIAKYLNDSKLTIPQMKEVAAKVAPSLSTRGRMTRAQLAQNIAASHPNVLEKRPATVFREPAAVKKAARATKKAAPGRPTVTRGGKSKDQKAKEWGQEHGYEGRPGGWIYNKRGKPVAHGWSDLYQQHGSEIEAHHVEKSALTEKIVEGVKKAAPRKRGEVSAAPGVPGTGRPSYLTELPGPDERGGFMRGAHVPADQIKPGDVLIVGGGKTPSRHLIKVYSVEGNKIYTSEDKNHWYTADPGRNKYFRAHPDTTDYTPHVERAKRLPALATSWGKDDAEKAGYKFGAPEGSVKVGDHAVIYSRGAYRQGEVTKVTPTKVHIEYTTPGGVDSAKRYGYDPSVSSISADRAHVGVKPKPGGPELGHVPTKDLGPAQARAAAFREQVKAAHPDDEHTIDRIANAIAKGSSPATYRTGLRKDAASRREHIAQEEERFAKGAKPYSNWDEYKAQSLADADRKDHLADQIDEFIKGEKKPTVSRAAKKAVPEAPVPEKAARPRVTRTAKKAAPAAEERKLQVVPTGKKAPAAARAKQEARQEIAQEQTKRLTLKELQAKAGTMGIPGRSRMKREDLEKAVAGRESLPDSIDVATLRKQIDPSVRRLYKNISPEDARKAVKAQGLTPRGTTGPEIIENSFKDTIERHVAELKGKPVVKRTVKKALPEETVGGVRKRVAKATKEEFGSGGAKHIDASKLAEGLDHSHFEHGQGSHLTDVQARLDQGDTPGAIAKDIRRAADGVMTRAVYMHGGWQQDRGLTGVDLKDLPADLKAWREKGIVSDKREFAKEEAKAKTLREFADRLARARRPVVRKAAVKKAEPARPTVSRAAEKKATAAVKKVAEKAVPAPKATAATKKAVPEEHKGPLDERPDIKAVLDRIPESERHSLIRTLRGEERGQSKTRPSIAATLRQQAGFTRENGDQAYRTNPSMAGVLERKQRGDALAAHYDRLADLVYPKPGTKPSFRKKLPEVHDTLESEIHKAIPFTGSTDHPAYKVIRDAIHGPRHQSGNDNYNGNSLRRRAVDLRFRAEQLHTEGLHQSRSKVASERKIGRDKIAASKDAHKVADILDARADRFPGTASRPTITREAAKKPYEDAMKALHEEPPARPIEAGGKVVPEEEAAKVRKIATKLTRGQITPEKAAEEIRAAKKAEPAKPRVARAGKRLPAAVKADEITPDQKKALLAHLDQMLTEGDKVPRFNEGGNMGARHLVQSLRDNVASGHITHWHSADEHNIHGVSRIQDSLATRFMGRGITGRGEETPLSKFLRSKFEGIHKISGGKEEKVTPSIHPTKGTIASTSVNERGVPMRVIANEDGKYDVEAHVGGKWYHMASGDTPEAAQAHYPELKWHEPKGAPKTGAELSDHFRSLYHDTIPTIPKHRNPNEYRNSFDEMTNELKSVDPNDPHALRAAAGKIRDRAKTIRSVSGMRIANNKPGSFHHEYGIAGEETADRFDHVASELERMAKETKAPSTPEERKAHLKVFNDHARTSGAMSTSFHESSAIRDHARRRWERGDDPKDIAADIRRETSALRHQSTDELTPTDRLEHDKADLIDMKSTDISSLRRFADAIGGPRTAEASPGFGGPGPIRLSPAGNLVEFRQDINAGRTPDIGRLTDSELGQLDDLISVHAKKHPNDTKILAAVRKEARERRIAETKAGGRGGQIKKAIAEKKLTPAAAPAKKGLPPGFRPSGGTRLTKAQVSEASTEDLRQAHEEIRKARSMGVAGPADFARKTQAARGHNLDLIGTELGKRGAAEAPPSEKPKTLTQLRQEATAAGIPGRSRMSKDQLTEALRAHHEGGAKAPERPTVTRKAATAVKKAAPEAPVKQAASGSLHKIAHDAGIDMSSPEDRKLVDYLQEKLDGKSTIFKGNDIGHALTPRQVADEAEDIVDNPHTGLTVQRADVRRRGDTEGALELTRRMARFRNLAIAIRTEHPPTKKAAPAKKAVAEAEKAAPAEKPKTLTELKAEASKAGIPGRSRMTKDQLAEALRKHHEGGGAAPERPTVTRTAEKKAAAVVKKAAPKVPAKKAVPTASKIDENVPLEHDPFTKDNMRMHGESLTMRLAQDYAKSGRNGSANRLTNLRRQATIPGPDHLTPQQVVDELKKIRADEHDPAFQKKIDHALEGIDSPMTPMPKLPESTPPLARKLIEDLHKIPYARKSEGDIGGAGHIEGPSLVDQLAEVYRDAAAGHRPENGQRPEDRIRQILRHKTHEINEASFPIWALSHDLESKDGKPSPLSKELRDWEYGKLGGGEGHVPTIKTERPTVTHATEKSVPSAEGLKAEHWQPGEGVPTSTLLATRNKLGEGYPSQDLHKMDGAMRNADRHGEVPGLYHKVDQQLARAGVGENERPRKELRDWYHRTFPGGEKHLAGQHEQQQAEEKKAAERLAGMPMTRAERAARQAKLDEGKALRARNREKNDRIEHAAGAAELGGQLEDIAQRGKSQDPAEFQRIVRQRLESPTGFEGKKGEGYEDLRRAMGDPTQYDTPEKLQRMLHANLKDRGITMGDAEGTRVKFRTGVHENLSGKEIKEHTPVEIHRPGFIYEDKQTGGHAITLTSPVVRRPRTRGVVEAAGGRPTVHRPGAPAEAAKAVRAAPGNPFADLKLPKPNIVDHVNVNNHAGIDLLRDLKTEPSLRTPAGILRVDTLSRRLRPHEMRDMATILGMHGHEKLSTRQLRPAIMREIRRRAGIKESHGQRQRDALEPLTIAELRKRLPEGVKPRPRATKAEIIDAVVGDGPTPKAHVIKSPEVRAIERSVKTGTKDVRRFGSGSMGDTGLVETGDGKKLVRKRMASDFFMSGEQAADAEQLMSELGRRIGAPQPAVFRGGDRMVYMDHVPGKMAEKHSAKEIAQAVATPEGRHMAMLDAITGHMDRHNNNWKIVDGKPVGLDNALAWDTHDQGARHAASGEILPGGVHFNDPFARHYHYRTYEVSPHFPGANLVVGGDWTDKNGFNKKELQAVRRQLVDMKPQFERLGRGEWYRQSLARTDALIKRAGAPDEKPHVPAVEKKVAKRALKAVPETPGARAVKKATPRKIAVPEKRIAAAKEEKVAKKVTAPVKKAAPERPVVKRAPKAVPEKATPRPVPHKKAPVPKTRPAVQRPVAVKRAPVKTAPAEPMEVHREAPLKYHKPLTLRERLQGKLQGKLEERRFRKELKRRSLSGRIAEGEDLSDAIKHDTPPEGLHVRDLTVPVGGGHEYTVREGTIHRQGGVTYLIEHDHNKYDPHGDAQKIYERLRAHQASLPRDAKAYQRSYAVYRQENPMDPEFIRRGGFGHDWYSVGTAWDGHTQMWQWNRQSSEAGDQIPHILDHEFGHNVDHQVPEELSSRSVNWEVAAMRDREPRLRVRSFEASSHAVPGTQPLGKDYPGAPFEHPVTGYGSTSPGEDYGDSVRMYLAGKLGTGRLVSSNSDRKVPIYFRDLFPERAAILDKVFPKVAEQQHAEIERARPSARAPATRLRPSTPRTPTAGRPVIHRAGRGAVSASPGGGHSHGGVATHASAVTHEHAYDARSHAVSELAKRPTVGRPTVLSREGNSSHVELQDKGGRLLVHKNYNQDWRTKGNKQRQLDAEDLGTQSVHAIGVDVAATHRGSEPGTLDVEFVHGRHVPSSSFIASSDQGKLYGLSLYLTGNDDANDGNWMLGDRGRFVSFDHAGAFTALADNDHDLREVSGSNHFLTHLSHPGVPTLADKVDWNPADLAIIRTRLEALKPKFQNAGRIDWWDKMMARLKLVEERADPGAKRRL